MNDQSTFKEIAAQVQLFQNIEQKEPLKKIPSTAANAIKRSANDPSSIQRKAQ